MTFIEVLDILFSPSLFWNWIRTLPEALRTKDFEVFRQRLVWRGPWRAASRRPTTPFPRHNLSDTALAAMLRGIWASLQKGGAVFQAQSRRERNNPVTRLRYARRADTGPEGRIGFIWLRHR